MRLPHTQLKNKHKGEDAYIIGSGASLDYYDKSFFNNKLAIAVKDGSQLHLSKFNFKKSKSNIYSFNNNDFKFWLLFKGF